jgi:hypothetical protein
MPMVRKSITSLMVRCVAASLVLPLFSIRADASDGTNSGLASLAEGPRTLPPHELGIGRLIPDLEMPDQRQTLSAQPTETGVAAGYRLHEHELPGGKSLRAGAGHP